MGGADVNRILMTTDTLGGVWTYCMVLARELASRGTEICLVTLGKKLSQGQRREATEIPGLKIFESDYKLEWMDNPWRDLDAAGQWLLQLEEEIQPDLVHLNSYAFSSLPWITPVLMVCHSCVFTWWQHVKGELPGEQWTHYYELVRQSLRTSDRLVAVSHSYASEMAACYRLSKDNIHVIYNGLDASDYLAAENGKKELVFGMGRLWDEGKNFGIVEKIVSDLAWPVELAGDAPDTWRSSIQGSEQSAGANRVTYLGKLEKPQVIDRLAKASVFVLPSRYEPFGLSALEAGLSGCALVLSNIPTLREIWQEAALYADPDEPGQWVEQINRLADDQDLRNELAHQASQTARKFTSKKMAAEYVKLYQEILHNTLCSV